MEPKLYFCWLYFINYWIMNEWIYSILNDNFTITWREDHGLARIYKESIHIRVNNPTLNRNMGKYNLHHIWDRVLFSTLDLKINNDNGHAHRTPISWYAQSLPPNRHVHKNTIKHPRNAQTPEHVHRTS